MNKIIISTCYFGKNEDMGHGISIARSKPRWTKVKEEYPDLFPSWDLINKHKEGRISDETYEQRYFQEVLQKLDPIKVMKELNGKSLYCWCRAGKFCHRHLVAKWLEKHGASVSEDERIF